MKENDTFLVTRSTRVGWACALLLGKLTKTKFSLKVLTKSKFVQLGYYHFSNGMFGVKCFSKFLKLFLVEGQWDGRMHKTPGILMVDAYCPEKETNIGSCEEEDLS